MGYIYLVTNKIDGKKYVGQTIRKDINKRWREHCNILEKQSSYFYNALVKYNVLVK